MALGAFLSPFRHARRARLARAQNRYPTHVVKIVLPVLPGSTTDILARLVASQLSEKWGKPVIVENMAGAAMNLGSEYVAHAAPDGYTLLLCPPAPLCDPATALSQPQIRPDQICARSCS